MSDHQIGLIIKIVVGIALIIYAIKDVSLLQVIALAIGVFLCDQVYSDLQKDIK